MAMQPSMKSLLVIAAIAGAAIAANCTGAAAQLAPIQPGDEMRTLSAGPTDIAEGKHLAETNCAGCHGANGISTTPGIPNLAGQRPAYLYLELKAYQSGARGDSAMNNVGKFLSDDALVKVAAYYASLDPAPAPAGRPDRPSPIRCRPARPLATAACAGCHGDAGVSQIPGIPSLVGQEPKYLIDAMKAYKTGQRKNDTMKAMLASVGDAADEQHRAVLRAAEARPGANPGRGRRGGRQGRSRQLAPAATATRASAAIRRRRASPARMPNISSRRCRPTRAERAATRR